MNWGWILFSVVLGIVCTLAGLFIGVSVNSEWSVNYLPVGASFGDWGNWVSGVGALLAVLVSLHLARRDDSEKVSTEVGVQALLDRGAEGLGIFIRAASVGRSPTTVVQVGVCIDGKPQSFCPAVAFTSETDEVPKYLARGQIFEASLDIVGISKVALRFYEETSGQPKKLHFEVRTGSRTYRVKPTAAAFDLLEMAFKSQAKYSGGVAKAT
ncbi:hypothetical protein [Pseudomonas yamanorum]|uniref:hypothetical protein n=1 Tax=Pseudomonas yamanorum TaxID=515393 RepID=UPI0007A4008A|nr:hypothetical protein [Pseudomonas yamanorum]